MKSPFVLPSGLRGLLAGLVMLYANPQSEIADLLDVRPGDRVLEIGYGPGALARILTRRGAHVIGVDPSREMRTLARLVARRADLRVGTAEATGLPDDGVDLLVSVNNVALWPDLKAGIRETHRVLRPGGRLVITWHGGTSGTRRFALPEPALGRIERAVGDVYGNARRQEFSRFVAFTAERR